MPTDGNIQTVTYSYKRESKQNPYTGITSFQHFRGESLYSDCVVKSNGLAGIETEAFECYPVPSGVGENGRNEGWYPDNSIVYIRVLWKEFEPEQGKYNYGFIRDIINKAKDHNQSLMFRLMPHSTCARDDVPEWLKKIMPCPERPDGQRVKDSPTDERFLELFGLAIEKIGEKFDGDPAFDTIDVCLPGAWGEGHNLHLYSDGSLKKFVDRYIKVFKKTHLVGQVAKPWLLEYVRSKGVKIGWRGDGMGHPKHMDVYYPKYFEDIPKDLWETAPVSFEAYWWLGEWFRQGWDIDKIIEQTLSWHISSFNPKSLPIPYEWKEKVEYWLSKMGYHYVIDSVTLPKEITACEKFEIELNIDNVGVAPIYNKIPLNVKLKGEKAEKVFGTDIDIRKWLPGKTTEKIVLSIPKDLPRGEYKAEIGISNNDEKLPTADFATDALKDGDYFVVAEIQVM